MQKVIPIHSSTTTTKTFSDRETATVADKQATAAHLTRAAAATAAVNTAQTLSQHPAQGAITAAVHPLLAARAANTFDMRPNDSRVADRNCNAVHLCCAHVVQFVESNQIHCSCASAVQPSQPCTTPQSIDPGSNSNTKQCSKPAALSTTHAACCTPSRTAGATHNSLNSRCNAASAGSVVVEAPGCELIQLLLQRLPHF